MIVLHLLFLYNFDFCKVSLHSIFRFKYFIIQVAEICLESNQFPRIQNLENWMNQQRCVKTPHYLCIKTRSTEICFSSKVILVSNTENALNLSNILRTKHEMVHPTNSFLLPTRAKEIFLETQRTQVLPYVTVCVLTATDIGTLTKQVGNYIIIWYSKCCIQIFIVLFSLFNFFFDLTYNLFLTTCF